MQRCAYSYRCACCSARRVGLRPDPAAGAGAEPCRAAHGSDRTARSRHRNARCARPTRSSCARCGACEFASCCDQSRRARSGPRGCADGAQRSRRSLAVAAALESARAEGFTVGRTRALEGLDAPSSFCRRPGCRPAARLQRLRQLDPAGFTTSITFIWTAGAGASGGGAPAPRRRDAVRRRRRASRSDRWRRAAQPPVFRT
jgi:hypothetical protein